MKGYQCQYPCTHRDQACRECGLRMDGITDHDGPRPPRRTKRMDVAARERARIARAAFLTLCEESVNSADDRPASER